MHSGGSLPTCHALKLCNTPQVVDYALQHKCMFLFNTNFLSLFQFTFSIHISHWTADTRLIAQSYNGKTTAKDYFWKKNTRTQSVKKLTAKSSLCFCLLTCPFSGGAGLPSTEKDRYTNQSNNCKCTASALFSLKQSSTSLRTNTDKSASCKWQKHLAKPSYIFQRA